LKREGHEKIFRQPERPEGHKKRDVLRQEYKTTPMNEDKSINYRTNNIFIIIHFTITKLERHSVILMCIEYKVLATEIVS
jgi:hypothetical protein